MKYGSLCSGIEAATCAWHPLGWKPAFFAEIESFPSAVLKHHYPDVPNLGDMTKFKEWPDAAIDVLVGGTPCQSFSVAGLRKGLDDPRGNLMLTYLAIADRYRPRWLVWENVPGVLSSNGGKDFGTFLGALGQIGYGWAYRVLDAQYFGVAQRRRRVFVVGHLGDWRIAAAVLFERHSLQGHPAPSREKGKGVAPTISARTKGGGGLGTDFDCDGGLIHAPAIAFDCKASGQNGFGAGEIASTLRSMGHANSHQNGGSHQAVAFQSSQSGVRVDDVHATLDSNNGPRRHNGALLGMQVRRLTPRECERLQGFSDDYTLIPFTHGKPAADGPRYKALGNSMAVPCMRWTGERIAKVDQIRVADMETT